MAPTVVMVAGPNGAGKTSVAPELIAKALRIVEYVNADMIARGISGFNVEAAAISAGRVMLARLDELAAAKASFAFERLAIASCCSFFGCDLPTSPSSG
jgi:predicted ABC-type ATPase